MDESTARQGAAEAAETASVAKDRAAEVAGTATDQAREVVDSAREQAGQVRDQAVHQAHQVVDRAADAIKEQGRAQTEQLAAGAHRLADQTRALAEGRPEEAGPVTGYVEQAASRVSEVAERLDQRGFEGAVDDLQRFARRRPGVFLLGAMAAGFGVGRLLRSSAAAGGEDNGNGQAAAGTPTLADTPAVAASAYEPARA